MAAPEESAAVGGNEGGGSEQAAAPPVAFKRRSGRKKSMRRRRVLNEGGPEDGDQEFDEGKFVETLQEQKARQRTKGVHAERLLQGDELARKERQRRRREEEEAEKAEEPEFGLVSATRVTQLSGEMGEEHGLEDAEEENPHMIKYVEEQLGMAQKQEEGEKKPAKKAVEDELYDLEVPYKSRLRAEADEGIQGASLPFSTGIAEVALPEEDRKRAHEAALRAAQEAEERANKRPRRQNAPVGGNLTANYSKHRKEFAEKRKAQNERTTRDAATKSHADVPTPAEAAKEDAAEAGGAKPMTSDDKAVRSFVRRTRR